MQHPLSQMPEMPVAVVPDPGRRVLRALETTRFTVHLIDSALLFGEQMARGAETPPLPLEPAIWQPHIPLWPPALLLVG